MYLTIISGYAERFLLINRAFEIILPLSVFLRFGSLIFFLSSLPMLTLVCCRLALGAALPDGAILGISLVGKIFITPATMCFINLIPTEIFPTKYRATATTIVVGNKNSCCEDV